MTEGLATMAGVPTPELDRLYGLWSDGGAGLLMLLIFLLQPLICGGPIVHHADELARD